MNEVSALELEDESTQAELREDFDHFDRNHDGQLQYGEFVQFLEAIDAGMAPQECRIGFREIDTDHDGVIGFGEFMAWWRAP